jgi:signal transduction histidine kinase
MGQSLRLLVVEDSETDLQLLLRELEQADFDLTYRCVETEKDYRQALQDNVWDLIISDYVLPRFSGPAALEILKKSGLDIPFIMISGKVEEDTAVEAIKAGASDYVMKDKLFKLIPTIDSELKEAEERRKNRETERELENFTASLTHDLRTPLLAEQRILEQIRRGQFGGLPTALEEVMEELLRSNQFLQHMLNNVLYTYKYKKRKVYLELHPTDLPAFLASVASSLSVQAILSVKAHKLSLGPMENLPEVTIDQHEIQRVLINLIKNACDHSPPGESILISAQAEPPDYVRIEIRDKGGGVAPEIQPFLFTPYTTTSARKFHEVGSGLGLYLSKQAVEAHHGKIGFVSIPHDGSVFYIELPINQDGQHPNGLHPDAWNQPGLSALRSKPAGERADARSSLGNHKQTAHSMPDGRMSGNRAHG